MEYELIEPISRAEAESAVFAGSDDLLRAILAVALHEADASWAEAFCTRFAQHSEPRIRGGALVGFGHLARRFRALDMERVRPLLLAGLSDPDPWVRSQSDSAADDAELFLGWLLRSAWPEDTQRTIV